MLVALLGPLTGCMYRSPTMPVSDVHLTKERAAESASQNADIPPPVAVQPPAKPKLQQKLPTYSVVVNEVPVKELLFALARDTKQNIDVHPALQGLVSLNAIDETLPSILDRIAKQTNLRWKQEGRTVFVTPDTPYVKTYRVNYTNVVRETESNVAVSAQITAVSSGGGGAGGAGGGGGGGGGGGTGNASGTTVSTKSKSDYWDTLEKNVRGILSASRAQALNADERAARSEALKAARDERIAQAEAVARAGQNAKDLFATAFESQQPLPLPGDATNEVVVNAVAGTVTVMGTEKQHALVQQYLDTVAASTQRQVLIEATIVEVELSKRYQAGVDWGRIANGAAGFTFRTDLLGSNLGTPPRAIVGYGDSGQSGYFGLIRLLEQFGTARVLSSPKVMALNNQTALLKVVRNVVYFQIQQQISQGSIGQQNLRATTTTARTVALGLVMSLTPQINENGVITLTVRPTVTSQVGTVRDPNPALLPDPGVTSTALVNEVPIVEIREIESMLQLSSGQVGILGGLIKDEIRRNRDQVPGIGSTPIGDAFAYRNENAVRTELVVFLRPVVVTNPSIESDELKFLKPLMPSPQQLTTPGYEQMRRTQ